MFNSIKRFFTKLIAPVVFVVTSVAGYVSGLFSSEQEASGSDEEPDPAPVVANVTAATVKPSAKTTEQVVLAETVTTALKPEPKVETEDVKAAPVAPVVEKKVEQVAKVDVKPEPAPEAVKEPVVEVKEEAKPEPKPVPQPEPKPAKKASPFGITQEEFRDMEAGNQANYPMLKRQEYLGIKFMLATGAKRKSIAEDIARGKKPQVQYGRGKFFVETPDGISEWTDFVEPPRQEIKTIADMYAEEGTKITATPHLYGIAAAHRASRATQGSELKQQMMQQRKLGKGNVPNQDEALGHLKAIAGTLNIDVSNVNEFADFTIPQLDALMLTGKDNITAYVKRIRDAKLMTM